MKSGKKDEFKERDLPKIAADDAESNRRFAATVKKMLDTPPKPHKPKTPPVE
ncbi:MAG: hypothetical protein HQ494_03700 [Rhodospirillales bacterium]|nr:hypothetical protein [Rhodospirillales bacterium]